MMKMNTNSLVPLGPSCRDGTGETRLPLRCDGKIAVVQYTNTLVALTEGGCQGTDASIRLDRSAFRIRRPRAIVDVYLWVIHWTAVSLSYGNHWCNSSDNFGVAIIRIDVRCTKRFPHSSVPIAARLGRLLNNIRTRYFEDLCW